LRYLFILNNSIYSSGTFKDFHYFNK